MATAIDWILEMHSEAKTVHTLSIILIFLSLFDIVKINIPINQIGNNILWASPLMFIQLAALVLSLIVVWKLCGIIIDMALAAGNQDIKDRADFRRKFYIALAIAIYLLIGPCILLPALVIPTVIIGLILAITIICLVMGLMKSTANMCRQIQSEPPVQNTF